MRRHLRLLLLLAALASVVLLAGVSRASYFESHPDCGHAATGFVNFGQSLGHLYEPSLGVCNWGFGPDTPLLQARVDQCISCSFTPAERPQCAQGTVLVRQPVWQLARLQECEWQGCWAGGQCGNGTAVEAAVCMDGSANLRCCPYRQYARCCRLLPCTMRRQPAGRCVIQQNDLLPGQQYMARVFSVPAVSTDCFPYSFETSRTCPSDRAFGPGRYYDACEVRPVNRDTDGCPKLPGYQFMAGRLFSNPREAVLPDGALLNSTMALAAGRDPVLMAARCDMEPLCAAFESNDSPDLRYYVPLDEGMMAVNSSTGAGPCVGTYAKLALPSSCPRIPGYLFTPQHTVDLAAAGNFVSSTGGAPCSDCSNASALAVQCDQQPGCSGFSSLHGLLFGSGPPAAQPLRRFTHSPCMGMYTRAASAYPSEVVALDQLLCGERVYCSGIITYSWSRRLVTAFTNLVDVVITLHSSLLLPRRLQDADAFVVSTLAKLPNLRSLTFVCANGSSMSGGTPVAFALLMPFLEELRISGCRLTGELPPQFNLFKHLRVLDLSANQLTGELPSAWSNMSFGYLNLSSNELSGRLPQSWRRIIGPRDTSPSQEPAPAPSRFPPPPPSARQSPPPASGVEDMLVADLSNNALGGYLDRLYVQDSCLDRSLNLQLQGPSGLQAILQVLGSRPAFLLHLNPGIADWAGGYEVAIAKSSYSVRDNSVNMCGAYRYLIAIGILWGVFGLCLLLLAGWSVWRWLKHRQGSFRVLTRPSKEEPGLIARLWSKAWFRRSTLVVRILFLLADLALDVRVAVWLFNDGDRDSGIVCTVFIIFTQAVIALTVYASLAHNLFSSGLTMALLAPVLTTVMPVLGPVLAFANVRNPDVPLVFWRYLELVEFSVALLQAPAETVTQTIVYARQNRMANGMYLDHALFLASIIFSMVDCLIALVKLVRYKGGPFRRVLIAFTNLDKTRDPMDYRQRPLFSNPVSLLEAPLNPSHAATSLQGDALPWAVDQGTALLSDTDHDHARGDDASPSAAAFDLPAASGPRDAAGPLETGRSDAMPPGQAADLLQQQQQLQAAGPHTFTPLAPLRYKSLLAQSAQRLGGGPFAPTMPSRLGPASTSRSVSLPYWEQHTGYGSQAGAGMPSAASALVPGLPPPPQLQPLAAVAPAGLERPASSSQLQAAAARREPLRSGPPSGGPADEPSWTSRSLRQHPPTGAQPAPDGSEPSASGRHPPAPALFPRLRPTPQQQQQQQLAPLHASPQPPQEALLGPGGSDQGPGPGPGPGPASQPPELGWPPPAGRHAFSAPGDASLRGSGHPPGGSLQPPGGSGHPPGGPTPGVYASAGGAPAPHSSSVHVPQQHQHPSSSAVAGVAGPQQQLAPTHAPLPAVLPLHLLLHPPASPLAAELRSASPGASPTRAGQGKAPPGLSIELPVAPAGHEPSITYLGTTGLAGSSGGASSSGHTGGRGGAMEQARRAPSPLGSASASGALPPHVTLPTQPASAGQSLAGAPHAGPDTLSSSGDGGTAPQ